MSDVTDLFAQRLKDSGNSLTKARQAVFAALTKQEPKSMAELVASLPNIDRASVYRAVSLFEELGIIQRLQIGWKYKLELSDAFHYHHHHISCIKCHVIVPLREDQLLEAAVGSLAHEYGFTPSAHQIEIQGLCRTCRSQKT